MYVFDNNVAWSHYTAYEWHKVLALVSYDSQNFKSL